MNIQKYSILLLLGGYLFLGVSHIVILPPWEGFDENAHFSYIQQIADTGIIPKLGSDKISTDVDDYMQYAPMPYCYVPLFKDGQGFTYQTYFTSPSQVIQKGYANVHLPPGEPREYRPSQAGNWQTQHPPLYYILLSPLFKMTRGLALIDQIIWLRLASYLLAWSALVVTVVGVYYWCPLQNDSKGFSLKNWMVIGTASIPLFFPSWYPEMARIGNDSLCALLVSILWLLLMRIHTVGKTYRLSILIGFILGLGCWTKAFFVPLSAGVLFCLFLHDYMGAGGSKKTEFFGTFVTLLILLVVSGGWFLGNWLEGGSLLGSNEMDNVKASGGVIESIRNQFSLNAWLRGHAAIIATLGWSCTWSFIRPPYIFMLPLAIMVVFMAVSYLCTLPRYKIHTLAWSPFWCAFPVIAGLSYHVLLMISLTGEGRATSGYYLLFMVPIIGSVIGIGLRRFWHKWLFKYAVVLFGLYSLVFAVVISWAQVMLFAGVIYPSDSKFYQLPDPFPPGLGLPEALANLSTLTYPNMGMLCWLIGGVLLLSGVVCGWRTIWR